MWIDLCLGLGTSRTSAVLQNNKQCYYWLTS